MYTVHGNMYILNTTEPTKNVFTYISYSKFYAKTTFSVNLKKKKRKYNNLKKCTQLQ